MVKTNQIINLATLNHHLFHTRAKSRIRNENVLIEAKTSSKLGSDGLTIFKPCPHYAPWKTRELRVARPPLRKQLNTVHESVVCPAELAVLASGVGL